MSYVKFIELTKNQYAMVDEVDYEHLSKFNWHVTGPGYARRYHKGQYIYMHREIMMTRQGFMTDHVNMDRLDNRRSNLRECLRSENMCNSRKALELHGDFANLNNIEG